MGNVWTKRFSRNGDNATTIVGTVKTESEENGGKNELADAERNDVTASDEEDGEEPGKLV